MAELLRKIIRPSLKKLGLYHIAYRGYFASRGLYFWTTNKIKKQFLKTAVILTYHRIDSVSNDPHLLCVTPSNFEKHLLFLKEKYEVISLPELLSRLQDKSLSGQEAVITLDDGYHDNFTNALPLLEKYSLPATIFVTTGFLNQQANLPWDMEYSVNDRARFLSQTEILSLSKNPLITIGAHTHTHPRLAKISHLDQLNELQRSRTILETITSQNIKLFAYPFGGVFDFTKDTLELIDKAGFVAACTTIPKLVTYKTNLNTLPRFNIRNYSEKTLRQKLTCSR